MVRTRRSHNRLHGLRFQYLRADGEVFALAQIVALECGTCLSKMLRPTRGAGRSARARQISIYLAHVVLARPQDVVAELFLRDRTTVAHACQAVEDLRDAPAIEALIGRVERKLAARMSGGA